MSVVLVALALGVGQREQVVGGLQAPDQIVAALVRKRLLRAEPLACHEARRAHRCQGPDVPAIRHQGGLRAATQVFAQRGFFNAQVADIARAAGVALDATRVSVIVAVILLFVAAPTLLRFEGAVTWTSVSPRWRTQRESALGLEQQDLITLLKRIREPHEDASCDWLDE